MRIGMVAPPWFEVPPKGYGGIEWLCHWLTEGLVKRGHEVVLIGSGNNNTSARFLQTFAEPPTERLGESLPEVLHSALVASFLDDLALDVVHDHSFAGPLSARGRNTPTIVTAHGPVDGEVAHYYAALGRTINLVAISDAQQRQAPQLPWTTTIHNGVPIAEYPFSEDKDDYLLFLGRMSPEKGAHLAIQAARDADLPLVIAGKCNEPLEKAYFETQIKPLLGPDIDWIGAAETKRKKELLVKARCLVFPIMWEEPFGIVMVEAMACGTPVVALRGGSVAEIVEDGVTGFICDHASDLPEAIKRSSLIEPAACRARALRLFDTSKMVESYERLYEVTSHR
ncbi:MAG TPA: glycosyltransferase family 4 protein [Actinomycetota bacterium]|nr:glycosyltransferase family 4 protein [Actinomycetota bacterium]